MVKIRRGSAYEQVQLQQAYGDEPIWAGVSATDPDFKIKMTLALNWANNAFDSKMLKIITLDYFKGNEEYAFLSDLAAEYFVGVGKQAWLRSNAAPITVESETFFQEQLQDMRNRYENLQVEKQKEEEVKDEERKLTQEQASKIHYVELYSNIDNMIASKQFDADKVYELIRNSTPTGTTLKMLADHYEENVADCDDFEGNNKLKGLIKFYNMNLRSSSAEAVQQIAKILGNVKAEKKLQKIRKPRKRKIKPANMQIKNLKFKETDSSLKLVSIPPTSIINAETLITFNTKTRKVAIFYAKNTDGLSVKGTTVVNCDTDRSKQKTVRKPEEMLEHLIGTSLKRFEKVFEGIKAVESKPKGRINTDTMLLKTFKVK